MKQFVVLAFAAASCAAIAAPVADFEDISLAPNSAYSGEDQAGGFQSRGIGFNNSNIGYAWSGFAASNVQDATTPGFGNQFAAIAGSGYARSANYGVAYDGGASGYGLFPTIAAPQGGAGFAGMWVTNTTYAYLSMANGDAYCRKFGQGDWFKLTATGFNGTAQTGATSFLLADLTSADVAQHKIVSGWEWFDLAPLGAATSVQFTLSSSDCGAWGMNTPAYFAVDNVTANPVPEPATMAALGLGMAFLARRRRGGRS